VAGLEVAADRAQEGRASEASTRQFEEIREERVTGGQGSPAVQQGRPVRGCMGRRWQQGLGGRGSKESSVPRNWRGFDSNLINRGDGVSLMTGDGRHGAARHGNTHTTNS
jgi:hypothetical protein